MGPQPQREAETAAAEAAEEGLEVHVLGYEVLQGASAESVGLGRDGADDGAASFVVAMVYHERATDAYTTFAVTLPPNWRATKTVRDLICAYAERRAPASAGRFFKAFGGE